MAASSSVRHPSASDRGDGVPVSATALADIRSTLVDVGLKVALVCGLPALSLVVLRAAVFGWSSVDWVYAVAIGWSIAAALLGHRIGTGLRAFALISTIWIGGVAALFSFGPAGLGLLILLTATIVAAVVGGFRIGSSMLLASIAVIATAAWVAPAGIDSASQLEAYVRHPRMWLVRGALFTFLAGCVLLLMRRFGISLERAIERIVRERDRVRHALDRVEREVEVRRKTEQTLRWTQYSLDQARTPIFWVRPDATFSYVNPAAAELLDCTLEEALALSTTAVDINLDREAWQELMQTLRRDGEVLLETRLTRRSGGTVPVEITANHAEFEAEEFVFAIVRDISHRKQMERERAALRTELEQSRKMEAVGRLAGGIAHDFNNLLQAIRGNAEMVLSGIEAGGGHQEDAREILHATDRAAELVRQLLTFSRQMPVERSVIDLGESIEAIGGMLRRLIGEDVGMKIEVADVPLTVLADRHHIEQILINLALNARDAMPDGGRLEIAASRASSGVRLDVVDQGTGIEPEILGRILEPFFTTKERDGTGLGLAIVYGIVEEYGGELDIVSEPGAGTRVTIVLPFEEAPAVAPDEIAEPRSDLYGDETVLLVEDDDAVRRVIVGALSRRGFRVLEAVDGDGAAAMLDQFGEEISCLVLDVVLPGRSGLEIYREVEATRPGIPVLFSSGYGSERVDARLLSRATVGRIQKPYSGDELAVALRAVLDAAQPRARTGSGAGGR